MRAVPREQLRTVGEAAAGRPLHVHLSEQVAENDACRAAHGDDPDRAARRGRRCSARAPPRCTPPTSPTATSPCSASAGTTACFCPTTERDLGDGIGPGRRLHDAGVRLTLGSDSHAVIDLFEEMRPLELDERLATQRRGHWTAAELLAAGTGGHASLGFEDAGAIAVGERADLVTLDTATRAHRGHRRRRAHGRVRRDAPRTSPRCVVDGRVVVRQGERQQIGRELDAAIATVWKGMA